MTGFAVVIGAVPDGVQNSACSLPLSPMYRAGSSPLAVVEPLLIGSCEKVTSGASRSVVLNHRLIVIGMESLNSSFDTTPPWVRST